MIKAYIAAFVAGLLSVLGAVLYRMGATANESENQTDDFNEYIETTKRINSIDASGDDDEWLRERSKRGRDL